MKRIRLALAEAWIGWRPEADWLTLTDADSLVLTEADSALAEADSLVLTDTD